MISSRSKKILELCLESNAEEEDKENNPSNSSSEQQPSCSMYPRHCDVSTRRLANTNFEGESDKVNEKRNSNSSSDFSEEQDDSDVDKNYIPEDTESSSEESNFEVFKTVSVVEELKTKKTPDNQEQNQEKVGGNSKNGVYSRKRKAERKANRNSGKAYVTAKGKEVKSRQSIPLSNCRIKCKEKLEVFISDQKTVRETIFDEYWSLGDRNKRVSYIAGLVDSQEPATSRKRAADPDKEKFRTKTHVFHLRVNGNRIRVCKGCFLKTLNETNMFVTLALVNKNTSTSGVTSDDHRGKAAPINKHSSETIQEVQNHILSFPLYNSHYTRRDSTRSFLPPHLNLRIMYELYCEQQNNKKQKPVSRQIYEREFHKQNLSFKEPKVDTCHKCDLLKARIKIAISHEERQNLELELTEHHTQADNAYLSKKRDKQLAVDDDTMLCYDFDLQQCLPTPMLNTSVAFYKRQLWTFNLTMHETSTGAVRCYMWHEAEGARGGYQIATCIYKEMIGLPPQVTKVVLYSDTCGGQNKNSHVAAMFLVVMQINKNLSVIDHKFMVSGHSHLECDVDHALIEKQKKKLQVPISHPHDWYQLVRSVGKKKKFQVEKLTHAQFLNFAELFRTSLQLRKKDSDGNQFNWHSAKWFRYTRDFGIVYYETSLEQDEPFKSLNLIRRGCTAVELNPSKCYSSTLAISEEKKKDILDLLPLIPPTFHDFYKNLKTNEMPDVYPDVEESDNGE